VPLHVLRDPKRKQKPSLVAQRMAKSVSTYAAQPNCDKPRMLAVSMNPPDAVGMGILRWILSAGDRRYWSWSATKRASHGKVRTSLMQELRVPSGNLSRALRPMLEDGIVEITEKDNGVEVITITPLGRLIFAEVKWRWLLMDADEAFLQPLADNYGWQEISLQISDYILVEGLDPTRKADVIKAAHAQLKDGVERGGPITVPSMKRR